MLVQLNYHVTPGVFFLIGHYYDESLRVLSLNLGLQGILFNFAINYYYFVSINKTSKRWMGGPGKAIPIYFWSKLLIARYYI